MNDLRARLAGMKDSWKKNKDVSSQAFGGNTVPAGTYLFKVSRSQIGETSKKSLAWFLNSTVVEGEHKGESVFNMLNLEHEIGQQVTAQYIASMGYEIPDNIADVVDVAEDIAKNAPVFKGVLKYNKDGYASIRVLEVVGSDGAADEAQVDESETTEPETTEDDLPANDIMETLRLDLVAFAAANGIDDVKADMSLDDVKACIEQYQLNEAELTKDEVQILEKAGLGDSIIRKTPAKKTGKK